MTKRRPSYTNIGSGTDEEVIYIDFNGVVLPWS